MASLELQLLGQLGIRSSAGELVVLTNRKAQGLLGYLASPVGRSRKRDLLAALLWPDSDETHARASLRHAIFTLRRSLASDSGAMHIEDDAIRLDVRQVQTDVQQLEQLLKSDSPDTLERGVSLCGGDLLAGLVINEEPFEQWLFFERERTRQMSSNMLTRAAGRYLTLGDTQRAIDASQRLVALDPLFEEGHRLLIRAYVAAGNSTHAIDQYETCRALLDHELGLTPEPATTRLVDEVRARRHDSSRSVVSLSLGSYSDSVTVLERSEHKPATSVCCYFESPARETCADNLEAWAESALSSRDIVVDAIRRYGGMVLKTDERSVIALFGVPAVLEDHAIRAVHAAHHARQSLQSAYSLGAARPEKSSRFRFGIASGEIIARPDESGSSGAIDAIGDPLELSRRLASAAHWGTVLVNEQTTRLAAGHMRTSPVTIHSPVECGNSKSVFELEHLSAIRTLWEARSQHILSPFVGRQDELARLDRALAQAANGHGQVIALVGEPGVGKSRLIHEFRKRPDLDGWQISAGGASPLGQSIAYFSITNLLRDRLSLQESDDAQTMTRAVRRELEVLELENETMVLALLSVLGIGSSDLQWHGEKSDSRRRRLRQAFKAFIQKSALDRPQLMILEDLHWNDASSDLLVNVLVDGLAGNRTLLITTFRSEYAAPWKSKSYYDRVRIDPLGNADATELLDELLGAHPSVNELKRGIAAQAEGNPLFIEESVRALDDAGLLDGARGAHRTARAVNELEIPPSIHSVLAARVDRLTGARKQLLQKASVIGRQVSLELLSAISDFSLEEFNAAIEELEHAEFLYTTGHIPNPECRFSHALLQDVTYKSLDESERKAYHQHTAIALENRASEMTEAEIARIAHHFTESGAWEKATSYWERAGRISLRRGGSKEAVEHFRTALNLVEKMEPSDLRQNHELTLMTDLGIAIQHNVAQGAPEAGELLSGARSICERTGDVAHLPLILQGLRRFYQEIGDHSSALDVSNALLALAKRSESNELLKEAHRALGMTNYFAGMLTPAREHLERVVSLHGTVKAVDPAYLFDGNPVVVSLSYLSLALWHLGYPDQALARGSESVAVSRTSPDAFEYAEALVWEAALAKFRREPSRVIAAAEKLQDVTKELEVVWMRGMASYLLGWAQAATGQPELGIRKMGWTGNFQSWIPLAEAFEFAGKTEVARDIVTRALAWVEKSGRRVHEAELYRIRGELILSDEENGTEAESCFQRALDLARSREQKSYELRAATSFTRLMANQGRLEKALHVLTPVYRWFSEGFDTADLRDAKLLLEALQ